MKMSPGPRMCLQFFRGPPSIHYFLQLPFLLAEFLFLAVRVVAGLEIFEGGWLGDWG
jgi:hypothetical protein